MLPLMAEVRRTVYYRITDLGRDVLAQGLMGSATLDEDGMRVLRLARCANSLKMTSLRGASGGAASCRAKHRNGAARSGAAGVRGASKGFYPAHGNCCQPAGSGGHAAQEMDRARDCGQPSEMRAAPSASPSLSRMTRLPALTKAAGHSCRACCQRRRTSPGRAAPARTAVFHAANSGASWTGAHRGAAGCVPAGRHRSSGGPAHSSTNRRLDALASIVSQLGGFHPFLLHGVTGSGKTAVYLAAMQRALDRGQSVDFARAGDRADSADGWPARRGLRRTRGAAALRAHSGGAHRAMASHPPRRSADRGRHALGDLCASAESRA